MSNFISKFQPNDICYTFDFKDGIIYRHVVKKVLIDSTRTIDTIKYKLYRTRPELISRYNFPAQLEKDVYTDTEIVIVAQTWLANKTNGNFADTNGVTPTDRWQGPQATRFTF